MSTQDSDVYLDPDSLTATISSATGGNFENLVVGTGSATAQIADTIDTTTVALGDVTVGATGTGTITASVDYEVTGTPLVITLDNGATVTIPVGSSTGTSTPFTVEDGDTIKITSTTGGNYEALNTTDTASQAPAFEIVKTAVVVDGTADSDGDVINYTITVKNTGNVGLTGVSVADQVESYSSTTATWDTTDTGTQGLLDLGETWTYTVSYTLTQADLDNKGGGDGKLDNVATGDTAQTSVPKTGVASVALTYNPAIDIVKTTIGSDGSEGDNVFVLYGGAVTWKYSVTNTGNVTLTNVDVTDSKNVDIDCDGLLNTLTDHIIDSLVPGGSVTCTASVATNSTPIGTWYTNTGTSTGTGATGGTATDSDTSAYYSQNPGVVTNSSLCDFGEQFRLVFTPDSRYYTQSNQAYKLSDSNPGPFFYNVFYTNDGSTGTISMDIPYPFVTQGAMPVHVYGGLIVGVEGVYNCFEPNNTLAAYGSIITLADYNLSNLNFVDGGTIGQIGLGDAIRVDVPAELGFQYINIHLDYGLEKLDGWLKQGSNAVDNPNLTPVRPSIMNLAPHTSRRTLTSHSSPAAPTRSTTRTSSSRFGASVGWSRMRSLLTLSLPTFLWRALKCSSARKAR